MVENTATATATAAAPVPVVAEEQDAIVEGAAPLVEEDLLVEDISIDGMCGVY